MNCERIREQLPVLLDDRLATAVASEIRAHLEGCPTCLREFTTLSQTLATLDTMPAPTPSPRLRARVYAAIAAEQHALRSSAPADVAVMPSAKISTRSPWFWLMQPLAAAALLALGFALGSRAPSLPAGNSHRESKRRRSLHPARTRGSSRQGGLDESARELFAFAAAIPLLQRAAPRCSYFCQHREP